MKAKHLLFIVGIGCLSFFTNPLNAQIGTNIDNNTDASYTSEEAREQRLADLKDEVDDTEKELKEARHILKEAKKATKEAKAALKAEKQAQKARDQANTQARKASKARETSNENNF